MKRIHYILLAISIFVIVGIVIFTRTIPSTDIASHCTQACEVQDYVAYCCEGVGTNDPSCTDEGVVAQLDCILDCSATSCLNPNA